eukprot:3263311-Prymnesium_polylepis.3
MLKATRDSKDWPIAMLQDKTEIIVPPGGMITGEGSVAAKTKTRLRQCVNRTCPRATALRPAQPTHRHSHT